MSDVEGSYASDDGTPPWTCATYTTRMRWVVSEIWRQRSQIQQLQLVPTQLPSSVGCETRRWWFYGLLSLAVALPQV